MASGLLWVSPIWVVDLFTQWPLKGCGLVCDSFCSFAGFVVVTELLAFLSNCVVVCRVLLSIKRLICLWSVAFLEWKGTFDCFACRWE